MAPTDSSLDQLCERFNKSVSDRIKSIFIGKDEVVDVLCVSLIAGENPFLLGPPGTAKSAVVQELAKSIDGRVFDYLLTKFTEPNEIFGPFDIRKLRDGELVTNTEGMLPEADFVFLDELLNANSAILNSLLMVLNERVFRRGRESRSLPTLMVVGASNHLPEDDALAALFDRFLLRVVCDNVEVEQLHDVLQAGWSYASSPRQLPTEQRVQTSEILELQSLIPTVDITGCREPFVQLISRLRHAGISISDRRAVKLQRLVAASALQSGRTVANPTDFWVMNYIWDNIPQQEVLQTIVATFIDKATEEEKESAHQAALPNRSPDPEAIGESLAQIENQLMATGDNEVERAYLRDQVGVIRQRIPWITNSVQADFLTEKSQRILDQLSDRS